tara:strand:+ start:2767 stop:2970 length:204 start_codon:yes stop_codon:yes gene_type:complete
LKHRKLYHVEEAKCKKTENGNVYEAGWFRSHKFQQVFKRIMCKPCNKYLVKNNHWVNNGNEDLYGES